MGLLDLLFGKKGAKHFRQASKATKAMTAKSERKPLNRVDDPKDKTWSSYPNVVSRPEGMVRLGATCEVAGTFLRTDAVNAAISAMRRGEAVEAELFREPDNPHDKNAIQVYISTKFLDGELIGYLPRDQALALSKYPEEMPISCEITSIKSNGDVHYVKLVVLIPGKRERTQRGWEI
ncbi:HIRAN domain-containing protein [Paracoccus sp. SM22M-07]|uniref:HIRAN domain-containing protein n=1 Tax=Paracoccus sp. SM22M-07 TaxID=1520813 RepID=UPI0009107C12|nr:HIRAN domain-containing protein [Paracoccus sp. SM22M-07]OJH43973.1 hypothetical protein IE00_13875 [Paracoccus sp. SM22M-07]